MHSTTLALHRAAPQRARHTWAVAGCEGCACGTGNREQGTGNRERPLSASCLRGIGTSMCGRKRETGNGKRETGNGKRETGNGERRTKNEETGERSVLG